VILESSLAVVATRVVRWNNARPSIAPPRASTLATFSIYWLRTSHPRWSLPRSESGFSMLAAPSIGARRNSVNAAIKKNGRFRNFASG